MISIETYSNIIGRVTMAFNVFLGIVILLFMLDHLKCFEIKSQFLKTLVYFSFVYGIVPILIWNVFIIRLKGWRIISMVYPIVFIGYIFIVGPIEIMFGQVAWKNQKVLFENKYDNSNKIELQIQDQGWLGCDKRWVEVSYFTSLFMTTSKIPNNLENHPDWIKIDTRVNELGLKYP